MGPLTLVSSGQGLRALLWENDAPGRVRLESSCVDGDDAVLAETVQQLAAYFAGGLTHFTVPLDLRGTSFQHEVWTALRAIPYGRTLGYGALARQIGRPAAARAVGAANGRNPVSIIVPCHRVIGAGGALTGFAGGIETKRWLLALEQCRPI